METTNITLRIKSSTLDVIDECISHQPFTSRTQFLNEIIEAYLAKEEDHER